MKNLLQSSVNIKDENRIRYEAKKHWISYVYPVVLTAVGSIGIIPLIYGEGSVRLIGLILTILFIKGGISLMKRIYTKIYLTEEYISISKGFLGSTITDISLKKLEGVGVFQNFIGKILNYGTLVVTTGDVSQSYLIKNPLELRGVSRRNGKYSTLRIKSIKQYYCYRLN